MAKIEAWEQRIRDNMEQFADQLNGAIDYALGIHRASHERNPEKVPPFDIDDPNMGGKLVERAFKHLLISEHANGAIRAIEDGDAEALNKAMAPISEFTKGIRVSLQWNLYGDSYRMTRVYKPKNEEEHPFVTASLVFSLDDYLGRYKDIVHLGFCRVCRKIYVKPKHGKKQRYCSRACQQRAYRERSKERGE